MSPFFQVCFVLLAVTSLVVDNVKMWKQANAGARTIYYLLFAAAIALWGSNALGYTVPLPSHFFTEIVSPWAHRLIHPTGV